MRPDVPTAIVRAAEVRAHGGSWSAASRESGWTERGIQRWIRANRALWAREVGHARRDSRDEACDESVAALRSRLRAEEDKTVIDAAKVVGSHFAPKPKPKPPPPPKDLPGQFLDLLATIPESETTRVDRHLQACEDEGRSAASRRKARAD